MLHANNKINLPMLQEELQIVTLYMHTTYTISIGWNSPTEVTGTLKKKLSSHVILSLSCSMGVCFAHSVHV
jgi:hypothetical protein